jgi:hypothetical protein
MVGDLDETEKVLDTPPEITEAQKKKLYKRFMFED